MNMMESRGILIQEATELLAGMELALLDIEENGVSAERINEIFRAAHTIKGSSGLFGLDLIVDFTHVMENLLVRVRNNEISIDTELTSLLLICGDYVGRLVDNLQGDDLQDPDPVLREQLLASLYKYEGSHIPAATSKVVKTQQTPLAVWLIRMNLSPDILRQGMDPVSFIYYLSGMGEIQAIKTHRDKLLPLAQLDPEQCYLDFSIQLLSRDSQAELEEALEFLVDGNDISVTPFESSTAAACASEAGYEIFAIEPVYEIFESNTDVPAVKAEHKLESKIESKTEVISTKSRNEPSLLKVDARKLDQLIDAVGELVTRSASGRNLFANPSEKALQDFVTDIEQFVEQIRERALDLRMAPVSEIFQRFPRMVRDTSKELSKKIDLQIDGADTELDKSMVDKLGDPLMHIVRNAMDHGIESVAARLAAGKPEQGSIYLNAYHESGYVVIEIADDGKGLDTAKILAKACERGLVDANQQLTEQQIFMLIFEPGFSTAETVTNLSGRGVGMDVVRRNIEDLRGTIEIQSIQGKGTQFRIRLPLTLSIIDGFQVAVGNSQFVIPIDTVVECVDLPTFDQGTRIINLRGAPLPFVRLADEFFLPEEDCSANTREQRQCLLVLQCGNQRAGMVVDRLVGELQAVIKPLSHFLSGIKGLSGSTILGDGTVALILDVAALLQRSRKVEQIANN
jgi:two-component system chemotaxis sensor kinase CheA